MSELNNIDKLKPKNGILSFSDDPVLQPSEKVWNDIHKKLKNKKKLNVLWIIMPFLITFSSAVIFLSNQNKDIESPVESSFSSINDSNKNPNHLFTQVNQSSAAGNSNVQQNDKEIEKEINSIDIVSGSKILKSDFKNPEQTQAGSLKKINSLSYNPLGKIERQQANTDNINDYSMVNQKSIDHSILINSLELNNSLQTEEIHGKEMAGQLIKHEQTAILSEINQRTINFLTYREFSDISHMKIESLKRKSKNLFWGLQLGRSLTSYDVVQNSQGNEIIESASYNNKINLGLMLQYKLSEKFSLSYIPSLNINKLNTNFDLNVKYDYNTETSNTNEKVNQFTHSLPTNQGSISTKMLVTRAKDSPVAHNEIINIDLQVDQIIYSIGNSLHLNYHFNTFNRGIFVFGSINPEIIVKTKTKPSTYHSNHTYVKEHSVEVKPESIAKNFGLYSSVGLGYKLNLSSLGTLQSSLEYKKGINSAVYAQGLMFNLGIVKSF